MRFIIQYLLAGTFFSTLFFPLTPYEGTERLHFLIDKYARHYGIDVELARDIARAESSFDPLALGRSGERGLYQIMPGTWEWLSEKVYGRPLSFDLAYEPEINIHMAMWYLQYIRRELGGRYTQAAMICAYNMGLGTLKRMRYQVPYTHANDIYRAYFQKESRPVSDSVRC